jgi:hypothetical protein
MRRIPTKNPDASVESEASEQPSSERLALSLCDSRCELDDTGRVAGDEVAQLYIRDVLASVARPVMQLPGLQRVGSSSKDIRLRGELTVQ